MERRPITSQQTEELEIQESIHHHFAYCKVIPVKPHEHGEARLAEEAQARAAQEAEAAEVRPPQRANLGHLTLMQTLPDNKFLHKEEPDDIVA